MCGLRGVRKELADRVRESIHSLNDEFQLSEVNGIVPRNFWSFASNRSKEAEMPAPLFVDCSVPMMVVTERTGPAVLCAFAVESSKTVVALDSIRDDAGRWRSNGMVADAGVVFVAWRSIVVWPSTLQDILNKLLAVRSIMLGTEPRQFLKPLFMESNLLAHLVESREAVDGKIFPGVFLPLRDEVKDILVVCNWESISQNRLTPIFEVGGNLSRTLELRDLGNPEILLGSLA